MFYLIIHELQGEGRLAHTSAAHHDHLVQGQGALVFSFTGRHVWSNLSYLPLVDALAYTHTHTRSRIRVGVFTLSATVKEKRGNISPNMSHAEHTRAGIDGTW